MAYVPWEEYYSTRYDILEQIKTRFDQEGIHFPYPQLDVHMKQDSPKP
jgi:small conductance mechanosensitive channel